MDCWIRQAFDSALIPAGGGVFSSAASGTDFIFPSGAFTDTVLLAQTPLDRRDQPATRQLVSIDRTFDLTAIYSSTGQVAQLAPGQLFTVTVTYANSGPAIPETLALWWWDESKAAWSQQGLTSIVDVGEHQVTAQVSHLSLFSVLGETHRLYLPLGQR